jgi:hypothetical protein
MTKVDTAFYGITHHCSISPARLAVCMVLTLALVLSGFMGQALADESKKDETPVVEFFDSSSFDRHLSKALRETPPQVKVIFPVSFTVNDIPDRLDKWFNQVEEYGGTVKLEAEDTPETRGVVGAIIDLIIGVYQLAKDKILYGPAKNYNAVIYYEKKEGHVTRVIFTRKENVGG